MPQFQSYDAHVEVAGEVILAFLAGFPGGLESTSQRVLEKHGIAEPKAGSFYPLQSLLNAMKEINDRMGDHMLQRIGSEIAQNAQLPPGIDSLEKCMQSIDVAYKMNHRNGDIGSYRFESIADENGLKRGKMHCHNPYPCLFDQGVIEGFAKRFKPADCVDVIVRELPESGCRRNGSGTCTYLISWV